MARLVLGLNFQSRRVFWETQLRCYGVPKGCGIRSAFQRVGTARFSSPAASTEATALFTPST